MDQFLTTIGKLLMDSDNASAVGDVFVSQPKSEIKNKLGTIAGIIELFGQSEEFSEKFFAIINDLETEYYLPPFDNEGGVETRFEECLQRANRRISKAMSDSLVRVEPKNINALVILIYKNKIYLSQIGKNNAFLFHRKKRYDYTIMDIFAQAGEKKARIRSDKMFSNIVNGAITEKDNLFFCNDSVLEYLSQNELLEIVSANPPAAALKEIQKTLEAQRKNNNFYAIAVQPQVLEMTAATGAAVATEKRYKLPPQSSINQLISTQKATEKFLAPSLAPNWKKALLVIYALLKQAIILLFKYLAITWRLSLKVIGDYSAKRRMIGAKAAKTEPAVTTPITTTDSEPTTGATETTEEVSPAAPLALSPAGSGFSRLSDWLNRQIAKFVALNRFQQVMLVAAAILVFFFAQSMVWQGRAGNLSEKLSTEEVIAQIEEYLNTGEAQNIFNDEAGAKESLAAAAELLVAVPDNRKYREQRENLLRQIAELEQSLQKIAYLENPAVVSDLSNQNPAADIAAIAKAGNIIFAVDNQNQNVYRVDLANKQTATAQLSSNFSAVKKIIALDENNLLILNGDRELYKLNFTDNAVSNVLTAESAISDFDLYGGRLYTLQPARNQIFKHFPVANGYNSGGAWIKDGSDLKNALTLTIDGGIYTATADGRISYFLTGRTAKVDFAPLEPPLNSPRQIFTRPESSNLYLLDQNNARLVVLDKNSGNLKIQYASKEFSELKSLVVEESTKNIYLLAGDKIYLIESRL